MSWDDGYVSQIEYDHGYYQTLGPLAIKLAALANGHQCLTKSSLRYLELGFGQGLSLNIHAAACDGEFWGNDFMPSQSNAAKIMAQASGANVTILDDSFAELAARADLPEFDVIVLYGVWTWVSDENREYLLKIIESKLALGGIVYISYNTSPGCTPMIPVRDLMLLYSNNFSPAGSSVSSKIKDTLAFMLQLMNAEAAYLGKAPIAAERLYEITKKDRTAYLAHEYFGDHWAIMPFSKVAAYLTNIGLTFCGNAVIRHFSATSLLPDKIKKILSDIKDPLFYESVLDFCVNQTFRTDLWIKGSRKLSTLQQLQLLGEIRFTLVVNTHPETELELNNYLGKIPLDKKITRPIIIALTKNDFEPKSINTLLLDATLQHLSLSQIGDVMLSLCGICVEPAHDEETVILLKPRTDKLNTFLINQSQHEDHSMFLASPVTGAGIHVPRIHQLSLLAIRNGFLTIEGAVDFIWGVLSSHGHCVSTSEGVLCRGQSENVRELTLIVTSFFETRLPILTALKIS